MGKTAYGGRVRLRNVNWDGLLDRLGPMAIKELRQGLRRRMFVWPFVLVQLLAVVAMVIEFEGDGPPPYTEYAGVLNLGLLIPDSGVCSGPFWVAVGVVCLGLMPLGGLMLMGQELEEGNYELLLMTPLTRWGVVVGKFISLWGLCLLTLSSLVPYAIVRYMVGGMDIWRNLATALTVVVASAIFCAATLGASAFRRIASRLGVLAGFLASFLIGGGTVLAAAAATSGGCGFWYHLNVLGVAASYVLFGLGLARSRIRLVVHHYELPPSALMLVLLAVTPFVAMLTSLFTAGYLGSIGLIAMALAARVADRSPRAPAWVAAPPPNIPATGGQAQG